MPRSQEQRPRFFEEQYLGAADLIAAVEYGRLQSARHALGAHTWGIAAGLQLKEKGASAGGGQVEVFVQPGYAWDGFGRPIVVLAPYRIPAELFKSIPFDVGLPAGQLIKAQYAFRGVPGKWPHQYLKESMSSVGELPSAPWNP